MDALDTEDANPPPISIPFATDRIWGPSPLRRWLQQRSRERWNVLPYPVEYQPLGGDAAQLAPSDLLEQARQTLLNSMGVPAELFQGGPPARSHAADIATLTNAVNNWPLIGADPASGPDTHVVQTFEDAVQLLAGAAPTAIIACRFTWGDWGTFEGQPPGGGATAHQTLLNGLVATGAYELETTEFEVAGNYTPGEDAVTVTPDQALQLMQNWGRDDIDEMTRREINAGLAAERPQPRAADCVSARVFNNRAVISWTNSGAHVERWFIERSIDGDYSETIAELPATARTFTDYGHLRDAHFEYYVRVYPGPRYIAGGPSRVIIPPAQPQPMRERLGWQSRECCMMMFGTPYYPGVEHYRNMQRVSRRIVDVLIRGNMQQDIMRQVMGNRAGDGHGWSFFRPDMP